MLARSWPFLANTLLFLSTAQSLATAPHEKRTAPVQGTHSRVRLNGDIVLPVRIALKQNAHALANAEQWLMDVSEPDSVNYGRHWTQDQVIEAFSPSNEAVKSVMDWLRASGITDFTHSDNRQWIAFDAPASQMESILHTEYFAHTLDDGTVQAVCDEYYLPKSAVAHVDYVTPGVKGSDVRRRLHSSKEAVKRSEGLATTTSQHTVAKPQVTVIDPFGLANCSEQVTPACIRALYNISVANPDKPISCNNSLGIFATGYLYIQGDIDHFITEVTHIPIGTAPIYNAADGTVGSTAANVKPYVYSNIEAELDVNCALPIVYPQNITVFQAPYHGGTTNADVQNGTQTFYETLNAFTDSIDGSYCRYASQESPTGSEMGCGIFEPTNVLSLSYGIWEHFWPLLWQRRQCLEYLKLALTGISVFFCTQDFGTGLLDPLNTNIYDFFNNSQCQVTPGTNIFAPAFPATCPWITSVGATRIEKGSSVEDREVAASHYHPYLLPDNTTVRSLRFTSGGGFSLTFEAPWYQKDAIARYFAKHDPGLPYFTDGRWQGTDGLYNHNGRGIPDISAVGQNILTTNASSSHPRFRLSDGTSASTPIVAALFSRIIEERLRVGKGRLGFVNPVLYKNPDILSDVLKGDNAVCCYGICDPKLGFQCAEGWDAVTGLGTPRFGALGEVFGALP